MKNLAKIWNGGDENKIKGVLPMLKVAAPFFIFKFIHFNNK